MKVTAGAADAGVRQGREANQPKRLLRALVYEIIAQKELSQLPRIVGTVLRYKEITQI